MPRNDDSPWIVPGVNERLIELHGDNTLSMRQIAMKISDEFEVLLTRNSVIGRSRRLGLGSHPGKPQDKKPAKPRKRKSKVVVEAPQADASTPIAILSIDALPLTIDQLHNGVCKWPLGKFSDRPPYFYCGEATEIGLSWCPEHYNIVYYRPRMTWA